MTIRPISRHVLLALGVGLLAGCGSGKDRPETPPTSSNTPAQSSSARSKPAANATAEEVANELRGKVKCPAKTKLPKRDSNAPVDDVVGVRLGMSYEEAANAVMCTHDLLVVGESSRGFQIQTFGTKLRQGFAASYAQPRVQKSSRDYMREMQDRAIATGTNRAANRDPGARWFVATMGMPGEERAISIYRHEIYEPERAPTVASLRDALIKKYGTPTTIVESQGLTISWSYDPRGRLVTETSPLYGACQGPASIDFGTTTSPDCGISTVAKITPQSTNPGMAAQLMVGVTDLGKGYELVKDTEATLLRNEEQRRAQQLQDAAKGGTAPTL